MKRSARAKFIIRGVIRLAVTALTAYALPASAQGGDSSLSGSARRGGDGAYRSFLLALPLASTERGPIGRAEWNLASRGSLALEASSERLDEDLRSSEVAATGESMMNKGGQATLMYFRYSRPASLAGWYYGLGAGYHEESVAWRRRTSDPSIALADSTYVNHNGTLKGATGHARFGYRYVGSDVPLLIGGYFGLRQFSAKVADGPATSQPDVAPPTAMTETEKARLLNRFQTTTEIGIEVGFVL